MSRGASSGSLLSSQGGSGADGVERNASVVSAGVADIARAASGLSVHSQTAVGRTSSAVTSVADGNARNDKPIVSGKAVDVEKKIVDGKVHKKSFESESEHFDNAGKKSTDRVCAAEEASGGGSGSAVAASDTVTETSAGCGSEDASLRRRASAKSSDKQTAREERQARRRALRERRDEEKRERAAKRASRDSQKSVKSQRSVLQNLSAGELKGWSELTMGVARVFGDDIADKWHWIEWDLYIWGADAFAGVTGIDITGAPPEGAGAVAKVFSCPRRTASHLQGAVCPKRAETEVRTQTAASRA